MNRPYCVVLTGGVGSGKSQVSAAFAKLGVEVIDTDLIARKLTTAEGEAIPLIRRAFGEESLLPDGSLDRRRLREIVFREPEARARLEGILHPLIRGQAARRLAESAAPYVLMVVPLLVESRGTYHELADRVLVVDCDPEQQVERLMRRDEASESMARAMLAAQANREQRLALADDIIDNRGDLAGLDAAVMQLHRAYLSFACEKYSR
jgi:dephospho-CoA kinase